MDNKKKGGFLSSLMTFGGGAQKKQVPAQHMQPHSHINQQTMIVNEEESKESNITIMNDEVKLRQKNLEVRSLEQ